HEERGEERSETHAPAQMTGIAVSFHALRCVVTSPCHSERSEESRESGGSSPSLRLAMTRLRLLAAAACMLAASAALPPVPPLPPSGWPSSAAADPFARALLARAPAAALAHKPGAGPGLGPGSPRNPA